MKKSQQILSFLLSVLLLFSVVPMTALTASALPADTTDEAVAEVLPPLPKGFHFTETTKPGKYGDTYYYVETNPSSSGMIIGCWIDKEGRFADLPAPLAAADGNVREGTSFPAQYDARDEDLITPVEEQIGGTCWAHAAVACMEANAIKSGLATKDTIDLDEYYFAWFGRQGYDANAEGSRYDGMSLVNQDKILSGGNETNIANAAFTFSGPVLESTTGIRPDGSKQDIGTTAMYSRMQEIYTTDKRFQYDYVLETIHDFQSTQENIKNAVLTYGAARITYDNNHSYFTSYWTYGNGSSCAFYNPTFNLEEGDSHAVAVVGWDDEYPATNFKEGLQPNRDGAWLCKNSWSSNWGENGYFWMSYDTELWYRSYAFEMVPASEYPHVYSYNGVSYDADYHASKSKGANVFVASGNEYLTKVLAGSYFNDAGDYTVSIYKNLPEDYTLPTDGTLVYTQSGRTKRCQFIDLGAEIPLSPGEIYAVVFEKADSLNYETLEDGTETTNEDQISYHYRSAPRESYIYKNGTWVDCRDEDCGNLYIQAVAQPQIENVNARVRFVCPGGYNETAYAVNGTVALPEKEGHTYVFTYSGAPFDGTNVTHDMTVLTHCYPTEGTVKSGYPCTRQYKCIYCNQAMKDEYTQHSYDAVVTPATPEKPGYTTYTCSVCGNTYQSEYVYYNGATGGQEGKIFWQIVDGTLYISGTGAIANYSTSNPAPWKAYTDEITAISISEGVTKIGSYAFYQMTSAQSIALPESMATVASHAFEEASALQSFTAPQALTVIGDYAFKNATALESVTLSDGMTQIQSYVFYGASALQHFTVPANVTKIGSDAFYNTTSLKTIQWNSQLKEIGMYAFCGASSLERFDAPESLESIGFYAFGGASSLKSITFNDNLKRLDSDAFWYCTSLEEAVVPAGLEYYGGLTYYYCDNVKKLIIEDGVTELTDSVISTTQSGKLEEILIPASVTTISPEFYGSYMITLKRFTVDPDNPNYCDVDGVLYSKDQTVLCSYPAGIDLHYVKIPATVNTITKNAFYYAWQIWYLDLSETGVTTLPTRMLYHTNNLDYLNLPAGLTTMEQYSVSNCTSLADLYIPSSVTGFPEGQIFSGTQPTIHTNSADAPVVSYAQTQGYTCEVSEAHAHAFTSQKWNTSATCAKEGWKIMACACGNFEATVTPPTGNHKKTNPVVTDATCEGQGYTTYTCTTCGTTYQDDFVDALGHNFAWVIDTPVNCGTSGVKHELCSRCNAVRSEGTVIPATGDHNWGWVIDRNADCGTAGSKHEVCSVCGATRSENTEIPATGNHTAGVPTETVFQQPTCGVAGKKRVVVKCTVCGATIDDHVVVVPATGNHNWEWVIDQNANCGTAGSKHEACSTCGATRSENTEIPATGNHLTTQSTETILQPATCGMDGKKRVVVTCTVCGTITSSVVYVIPATGNHTWVWIVDQNATCGTAGFKHQQCGGCGATQNEHTVISPTGEHSWTWVVDQNPTCGTAGRRHQECNVCHSRQNENTIINPTGNHNWQWVIDRNATCNTNGKKHEACTGCGATRSENTTIPATGAHGWAWVVDTEATCGTAGVKHEECSYCHITRSENTVIDPTGVHTYTAATIKDTALKSAAACAQNAVYYYSCKDCGTVEKNDSHTFEAEGTALRHVSSDWIVDRSATCKAEGSKHIECTVCHAVLETQTIEKQPHTPKTVPGKAATCKETGLTDGVVCSVCGDVLQAQTVIGKKAHSFNAGSITKQPTCTAAGVRTYTCTACGDTKTEPVAALGHAWGGWTTVKEPTCTETGLQQRICGNDSSHKETRTLDKKGHTDNGNGYCKDCGADLRGGQRCKYCGETHGGAFGWLIKFFHSILAAFGLRK